MRRGSHPIVRDGPMPKPLARTQARSYEPANLRFQWKNSVVHRDQQWLAKLRGPKPMANCGGEAMNRLWVFSGSSLNAKAQLSQQAHTQNDPFAVNGVDSRLFL